MKLSDFEFDLPEELLSEYPSEDRDECKLMVIDRNTGKIEHKLFKDLINYFDDGDVMVLNNTKVFPARFIGNKEKTNAEIEVFLLRELNKEEKIWDVIVDPARKVRIGNKVYFDDSGILVAEIIDNTTSRGRIIKFLFEGKDEDFKSVLNSYGKTPLPKYIKRKDEPFDKERYQTIYAKNEGSIAAPTAGLHFSKNLMKKLEIKGINFTELTLHIGLGTFEPILVEDLSKHDMHSENLIISQETADLVNRQKEKKKRICAVGTSVIRGIESSVSSNKQLKPFEGWTNKFIFPPYNFAIPNCMITNFHISKSALLVLVAAFAGKDLIMEAYKEAIKEKYNFYSYGDAMLVL